ncbi:MAG: PASTA domain-containing protein [Bacilli bacterium]
MGDFTNTTITKAMAWASANNITIEQEYQTSDIIPAYYIINQNVTAGTLTKEVEKIEFIVSTGPDYNKEVIVPNMLGWNVEDVINYINTNYLNNVNIEFEFSTENKDSVITQDNYGQMKRSDEINIIFSLGTEEDLVPIELIDLTGKSKFEATLWLKRNGIPYKVISEFSDEIERNYVISQKQETGTMIDPKKDTIDITMSKGKEIIVPDILNMNVEDVTKWIIDNNLRIKFSDQYDEKVKLGKIISCNYKKDDIIEEQTEIAIVTSKGQLKMEEFTSLYDFREWASKYNINYEEAYEFSTDVAKGKVISYSHNKGQTIGNKDIISITVSQGAPVTIPNFYNMSWSSIKSKCSSIGLSCSYAYGDYNSKIKKSYAYKQSKSSGAKVVSGTSVKVTLSMGAPVSKTLYIQETWLVPNSASSTISSLKTKLTSDYPGVTFSYVKKPSNSQTSGFIHKDSPTNTGSTVKQGKTYTIWVVSN